MMRSRINKKNSKKGIKIREDSLIVIRMIGMIQQKVLKVF